MANLKLISIVLSVLFLLSSCGDNEKTLNVTATAYNLSSAQTDGNPHLAAWEDTISHGEKIIAVSRDLIDSGLTRGTKVKIEGLKGEYTVLDKMDSRWKMKIDIFMGKDFERAKQWGEKEVTIKWNPEE